MIFYLVKEGPSWWSSCRVRLHQRSAGLSPWWGSCLEPQPPPNELRHESMVPCIAKGCQGPGCLQSIAFHDTHLRLRSRRSCWCSIMIPVFCRDETFMSPLLVSTLPEITCISDPRTSHLGFMAQKAASTAGCTENSPGTPFHSRWTKQYCSLAPWIFALLLAVQCVQGCAVVCSYVQCSVSIHCVPKRMVTLEANEALHHWERH